MKNVCVLKSLYINTWTEVTLTFYVNITKNTKRKTRSHNKNSLFFKRFDLLLLIKTSSLYVLISRSPISHVFYASMLFRGNSDVLKIVGPEKGRFC